MALGSTQPLTEMSTRSISWGWRWPVLMADNLPPSCAVVMKSGNLNFPEPPGHLGPVTGLLHLLLTWTCVTPHNFATSVVCKLERKNEVWLLNFLKKIWTVMTLWNSLMYTISPQAWLHMLQSIECLRSMCVVHKQESESIEQFRSPLKFHFKLNYSGRT